MVKASTPRRRRPDGPAVRRTLRVLFFAEGASLAHAARPLGLAGALPRDRYEVFVAAPERYRAWAPEGVRWLPLQAQSPEASAERLRRGRPVFSRGRLEEYARHDLELIREVRPHVVVGDLRLSLAASARRAPVPYISISNAYWSPDRPLPLIRPQVDTFRGWPGPAADLAFQLSAPLVLAWHAAPVDELMAAHGLERPGRDLRRAFTEADLTLWADLPALFPGLAETPRRRFLGPVAWEPEAPPPPWWDEVPTDKPLAYVSLGASGGVDAPDRIVLWLSEMGYVVMLAAAGRARLDGDGRRLFVADQLPGEMACARADLVVCNGDAPTATQALVKGRPVLGVASNMDQFLNMRAVQARGAGRGLRADALTRRSFEDAVGRLEGFRAAKAVAALAGQARSHEPARVLMQAIDLMAAAAA